MTILSDITIIGAGALGLLTAREFHKAGASVTVLEKGFLARESSWAGGGILLPLYPWRQADAISQLVIKSHALYPTLTSQLLNDTGINPEWIQCGLLMTQNPDICDAINWCENYKIPYQKATKDLLNDFNTQTENPLWLPDIAQARNPRLLKALIQDLKNKGVIFIEQCELTSIQQTANSVKSIHTTRGQFNIEQLIITTGAWTGELFKQLFSEQGISFPDIIPAKGQMIVFKTEPDILKYMVLDGDKYLIPRCDGHILAGSSVEYNGFDKSTTQTAKENLQQFALNLFPTLKNYSIVNHWAGLRPATKNGIPYIDKLPKFENVYINAGHFRNGLIMSPASAQLLVDIVLKRKSDIDCEPYRFNSLH